ITIGILNGRDGCRTASGHMVREREIHALCSNGGRVAGRGLSVHYSKGRPHTTGNPDNHPHTRSDRASYGHGTASDSIGKRAGEGNRWAGRCILGGFGDLS